MKLRCLPLLWALALLVLGVAPARAQANPPPAEAFFHNAQFSTPKFSPDGRRVAFLVAAKGGHARLGVLDLDTMQSRVAMSYETSDIWSFEWVNDTRLVYTQNAEHLGSGLFAVNHDGKDYRQLVKTVGLFVEDPHDPRELMHGATQLVQVNSARRGDEVFVATQQRYDKKEGGGHYVLSRLNTRTGRWVELDTPPDARRWLFDRHDEPRVIVTSRGDRGQLLHRQPGGDWRTLAEFNPRDPVSTAPRPLFLAPDGQLYVSGLAGGDKQAVYTFDLASGRRAEKPLLVAPDYDLAPSFVADDERLLGLRYTADAEATVWLDPQLKAQQALIDALLPATSNHLSAPLRPTLPYLLVTASSDVRPPVHYLYHTGTRKLSLLGAAHPEIKPAAMGTMDPVRYQARDGLEIPAWLTLPRGSEKLARKNLPMVVLVHGGPWSRGSRWGWDRDAQFLASRGYAVLQPEFRGSTGYGLRHFKAGWQQWGLAMQNDLADAARWAIAQGVADPQRICIMGASYGGYATLMGLVNDPGLFRCGINYVGVTDIDLMFSVDWSDVSDEAKRYGYGALIGDPVARAAQFKATSPLQQAARIRQPVLMAYGEWDRRVPLVHGEKMRDALKAHNPQVEWVVYEKEGHGWTRVETRLDFWGRVERFLARHLAATP